MFDFIRNRLKKWRRKREAVRVAIRHFEDSGGRDVIRSMCSVIAVESERCIVRVCHEHTRPPRRRYYAVYGDTGDVKELSFETVAAAYGERPWR